MDLTTQFTFSLVVFGAVFLAVVGVAFSIARSVHLRRRLQLAGPDAVYRVDRNGAGLRGFLAENFDEKFFKLKPGAREELRNTLIRAGFFRADAVWIYLIVRASLLTTLPVLGFVYGSVVTANGGFVIQVALAGILFLLAWVLPTAFLSRRRDALEREYRISFPDMLDWMVVCSDAGLSLESSIDRIAGEMADWSRALGLNLALVSAEIRAGRSTVEALQGFAGRVGITEATSLATLLRQSNELGTSIGQALRIYSDEMRDRRLTRAEERAHKLPVKLVLPLTLFIFPTVVIVLMLPMIVRFATDGVIPGVPK